MRGGEDLNGQCSLARLPFATYFPSQSSEGRYQFHRLRRTPPLAFARASARPSILHIPSPVLPIGIRCATSLSLRNTPPGPSRRYSRRSAPTEAMRSIVGSMMRSACVTCSSFSVRTMSSNNRMVSSAVMPLDRMNCTPWAEPFRSWSNRRGSDIRPSEVTPVLKLSSVFDQSTVSTSGSSSSSRACSLGPNSPRVLNANCHLIVTVGKLALSARSGPSTRGPRAWPRVTPFPRQLRGQPVGDGGVVGDAAVDGEVRRGHATDDSLSRQLLQRPPGEDHFGIPAHVPADGRVMVDGDLDVGIRSDSAVARVASRGEGALAGLADGVVAALVTRLTRISFSGRPRGCHPMRGARYSLRGGLGAACSAKIGR